MALKTIISIGLLSLSMATQAASDADEYYSDAQRQLKEEDFAAAAIQLKNALQADPGHGPSRVLLGSLSLRFGDAASAEKEFRRARAIGMPAAEWEIPLGQAYLAQGKNNEVIAELSLDEQRAPQRQAAIAALHGQAFLQQGSFTAAAERFDLALSMSPGQPQAWLGKARLSDQEEKPSEALQFVDKAIAADANNADAHALRGQLLLRAGEQDAGVKALSEALERNPAHRDALFQRAGYYLEHRQYEQALKDIAVLQRRHPAYPGGNYLASVAAFQQGDFEAAQEAAAAVLQVSPNHARSLVLYGVTALLQGQEETAQDYLRRAKANGAPQKELDTLLASVYLQSKSYERVIETLGPNAMNSDNVQTLVLLGAAYMGKGNQQLGSRAYGRAIELAPTLPQLRTQLGIGLMFLGEKEEGMDTLESAANLAGDSIEPGLILVIGHLDLGNIPGAKQAALALEKKHPQDIQALTLTGVVLLAADEPDAALERFDEVLTIDPRNVVARIHKARVYLAKQDSVAAKRQFDEILEQDAADFDALTGLMALADQADDTEKTEYWVGRALQTRPSAVQPGLVLLNHYLRLGKPDKALQIAHELYGRHPDNPTVLFFYARAQIASGQIEAAISNLKMAADRESTSTAIWSLLAKTQLQAGDISGVRSTVEKILALDPENVSGLAAKATIALRNGNSEQALAIADKLRVAHPERPEGYRLLGTIAASAGDLKTAEQDLRRAYEIDKTAEVTRLLSALLERSGRIDDARQLALDWLAHSPGDIQTRRELAVMLQRNGRAEQAAEQYEALLTQKPGDFAALNNLAWIRHEAKDERALDLARRAYQAAPGNAFVIDTYGWILFKTEHATPEPQRLLKEALLINPANPDIRFHLATVLAAAGDKRVVVRRPAPASPAATAVTPVVRLSTVA